MPDLVTINISEGLLAFSLLLENSQVVSKYKRDITEDTLIS